MVFEITTDKDGFYIVKDSLGRQIIKKSTLVKATKALANYVKGQS